jgi:phage terminase small subunit
MEMTLEIRSTKVQSFCDARNSFFAATNALRRRGLDVAMMKYAEKQEDPSVDLLLATLQKTQP